MSVRCSKSIVLSLKVPGGPTPTPSTERGRSGLISPSAARTEPSPVRTSVLVSTNVLSKSSSNLASCSKSVNMVAVSVVNSSSIAMGNNTDLSL